MLPLTLVILCLMSGMTSSLIRVPLLNTDSLRTALQKAGKTSKADALKFRTSFSTMMRFYSDAQHVGQIGVGSPPQYFYFLFDSGSSHMWLPSIRCVDTSKTCEMHNKYDHSMSSTYRKTGSTLTLKYDVGNVFGYLSTDSLFFKTGEYATNQTFLESDRGYDNYDFTSYDGVIGLGFQMDSVTPLLYNLYRQNLIEAPVYSIFLPKHSDPPQTGELILGGSDPKRYIGELRNVSITHKNFWQFDIENIHFNGRSLCPIRCEGVIDTTTSFILGPEAEITKIFKDIGATPGGYGMYKVNCNKIADLPSLTFIINGVSYNFTSNDYILRYGYDELVTCYTVFMKTSSDSRDPNSLWIFGDAFFRKYYAEFDLRHKQISFALSNSGTRLHNRNFPSIFVVMLFTFLPFVFAK